MARRRDYKSGGVRSVNIADTQNTPGKHWADSATTDGFDNFAAKLGMGQDNMLAKGGYVRNRPMSQPELEEMYRTSWVVARAVEVVAEDMVRCNLDIQGSLSQGEISELLKARSASGITARLTDGAKWGRLFGGALAIILIDGQDLAAPLELDTIPKGGFRGLYVLDRHQVNPSTQRIKDLGPMLGYPEYYTIQAPERNGQRVHHSRAIRFIGVDLPGQARQTEQGWGASVVERIYDRIMALDSATHGSANLLFKSFLRVIGVENLRTILAQGGKPEHALHKMFGMIRQMQSNEGITLLDKQDTYQVSGWSFAGIYDALQAFAEQISGGTGIPLVRLLGQSPKGFSSGDSDLRTYYDTVATQAEDDLRPAYNILFPVLARHLWQKPLPDDFSFDFQSLYLPTEIEKSQIATADAQSIAGLFQTGLIDEATALSELRDAGRTTGRFSHITDEQIEAARKGVQAPVLPEGFVPSQTATGQEVTGQEAHTRRKSA